MLAKSAAAPQNHSHFSLTRFRAMDTMGPILIKYDVYHKLQEIACQVAHKITSGFRSHRFTAAAPLNSVAILFESGTPFVNPAANQAASQTAQITSTLLPWAGRSWRLPKPSSNGRTETAGFRNGEYA